MHPEAYEAVRTAVHALNFHVRPFSTYYALDVGGRHVNGSVHDLFHPATKWTVIDREPGEGVDIVADACEYLPGMAEWCCDVVIATEVFEHEPRWPLMLHNMSQALRSGGALIVTAACDPRPPHSAIDGGPVREGEAYENVDPESLRERVAAELGLGPRSGLTLWTHPRGDVYVYGRKA